MLPSYLTRSLKVFTPLSCSMIGFHLVFRQAYDDPRAGQAGKGKDHVFSDIQRKYNGVVDNLLGLEERK